MIAFHHLEGAQGQQRMKPAYLDARLAQAAPEAAGRADRSERVVQDAHAHLGRSPLHQDVGEAPAGVVVADDVVLEVDPPARGRHVREHRRQGDGAIGVVLESVALDGAGTRRAVDRETERVAHPAGAPAPPRPRVASTGRSA